jgi:hypothetical protein
MASQEVHDEMLDINESHLYDESISSVTKRPLKQECKPCIRLQCKRNFIVTAVAIHKPIVLTIPCNLVVRCHVSACLECA